ncbi:quinolinate synthase A [Lachnospiraceae bacterium]|nr:quinolinate synthase A [Lachnospiraceae bacterium]
MTKQEEIQNLKKEKDAVILAHYYVRPEIQEIADYTGDSYFLSKKATTLPHKTIVLCGVSFMGESTKLLNPSKTVLMPNIEADCPMAHMVDKLALEKVREQYKDLAVVCYINSTAQIKSWSDVSVTSANAISIIRNLPNKNILFIPDKNLAHFIAMKVPEKNIIFQKGFCPIHENMRAEEIQALKLQHPEAKVLVHPECNSAVLELADYVGSTSEILSYVEKSPTLEFIIGTELGVYYTLQQARPDARFYFPNPKPICSGMKQITLENVIEVLKTGRNEISMQDNSINKAASRTLERMLELAK